MKSYYHQKYPFFNYQHFDPDGHFCTMFSVPIQAQIEMFRARRGNGMPKSFFDCGCATGELLLQAEMLGMQVRGIDIKDYPIFGDATKYVMDGRLKTLSVLDHGNISADMAFANGILTYFNESDLESVLSKFGGVKMLIAIHNTTEDVIAAQNMGQQLSYTTEPRLIRPNNWWIERFIKSGFKVDLDKKYNCFCAIPSGRHR